MNIHEIQPKVVKNLLNLFQARDQACNPQFLLLHSSNQSGPRNIDLVN